MDATIGNDTGAFDIDILRKIQSDIKSEWEGDEPGINFFLLLIALFGLVVWVVFISFFFSRLLGLFVGHWFRRFLKWSGFSDIIELSIGSFSISILSGKIMFRDFLLVTGDFTLRINDGWIILSYWKYIPKNCTVQDCMNVSRLHILINGLKLHVFNRMSVYQNLAKQAGMPQFFNNSNLRDFATTKTKANTEMLEMQLDSWWDKIWRLFGAIRFEVTSGRLIAGNSFLPTACTLTFENFQSRIFLTDASNKDEDRYMFRLKATVENIRIALIKATDFVGNDVSGIRQEDPPRTMGDGFAILQSAMIQFYYHQDLLGLVKEARQSANLKVPVWETIWRLDKNTIFSYGPWADKQRALIYSFFFPSDFGCMSVTEMPKKGERRILINHDVRVSLLHDASIDFWFMRNEELNAIHSRVKQGSSFEFYIPFVITEKGFISDVRGSLLCLESTTSLPFREFISCETFRFNVTMNYPRSYNHHQTWDICIELHHFSTYLLWDHKRLVMEVINEWNSDNVTDLCKFVPCTWNINISVVDKFEIALLLNDKNWVDTSSTNSSENVQAVIVGSQLYISFALDFTEFEPDKMSFELSMKAEDNVAIRAYIPPQNALASVFAVLANSAKWKPTMKPSKVQVNIASDENWFEVLRTELITLKCEYEYFALARKFTSDIPLNFVQRWTPSSAPSPWTLEPDSLFIEVNITSSETLLSGLFLKLILNFKDNYFSDYDKISDITTKPLHCANTSINVEELDVEHYRTMNTFFKLKVADIRAHCLTHGNLQSSDDVHDFCPVVTMDEMIVELKKDHLEFLVQVSTSPITVEFSDVDALSPAKSKVFVSGLQFRGHSLCSDFEVPWSAEVLEYAWLVEVIVGDINGQIRLKNLITTLQFLDSFLVLALFVDEEMEMPERSNICHHFQNIRFCSKSNLKIIDNRNRWQKCESVEALKYRNIRVSVDCIDLLVNEDRHLLELRTDSVRFSFCNAHSGLFVENLLLKLGVFEVSQYVKMNDKSIMRCGYFTTNKVKIDFRLPYKQSEHYLPQQRKQFLLKHDRASNYRLYFLWKKDLLQSCACFGSSRFFAENDLSGAQFFNDKAGKLANCRIQRDGNAQPFYLQSILDQQCCALQHSTNRKESILCLDDNLIKCEDDLARKSSDASFHSASSKKNYEGIVFESNITEYAKFLEVFEVENFSSDPGYSLKKISNGICGVKLVRKENLSKTASAPYENNRFKMESERSFHDFTTFGLKIDGGSKIELLFSIISLEAVEKFVASFSDTVRAFHPSYLAQKIYRNCSMSHHDQPLTASIIFRRKENSFSPSNIHVSILIPTIDICLLKCKDYHSNRISASNSAAGVNAIALLQLQPSHVEAHPPALNSLEKHLRLIVDWRLAHSHFELLTVVEQSAYDNVFNKVPVSVTTNWSEISATSDFLQKDVYTKIILDVYVPETVVSGTLGRVLTRPMDKKVNASASSSKVRSGNRLNVDVKTLNVTFVLGKSIEDPPTKTNTALNRLSELSFFEVMAPVLSAWSKAGIKCQSKILDHLESMTEWNDLVFMKLLADALDWHNDGSITYTDKTNRMQDVLLYYRNIISCPSCKLVQNLMQYAARNNEKIQETYLKKISENFGVFKKKDLRKTAVVALLSHWQTVICSEIQLADNMIAHKYKYNTSVQSYLQSNDVSPSKADTNVTEKTANNKNEILKNKKEHKCNKNESNENATTKTEQETDTVVSNGEMPPNNTVENHQKDGETTSGHKMSSDAEKLNNNSLLLTSNNAATAADQPVQFRPAHRRGPSTATQLTVSGNEKEPQDLYHWILKAHKEYKDRRTQFSSKKASDSVETDINSMELLLSVFFWTIYQELELERSTLDSLPTKNIVMDFGVGLEELKFSVVEKKFLISQQNEILVALSSHRLLSLENFELAGKLNFETKLDEFQLRPAWGNCCIDYSSKIQDVRLVVSLASVFFINDLAMLTRFLINDIENFISKAKSARDLEERINSPSTTFANFRHHENFESWPAGVLDKLHDYQRTCTYKRRDFLHINLVGNWSLKMAVFESMITDLFISMTLLKLQFQQRHSRILSSLKLADTSKVTNLSGTLSKPPKNMMDFSSDQECNDLLKILSTTNHCGDDRDGNSLIPLNISNSLPVFPLTLDYLNFALKRTNLIVAEHIVTHQRNSDTRQILNCSLRESSVVYERLIEKFKVTVPVDFEFANKSTINKLSLSLGELEADLPMHAQSIHEMVMRHGPQLNEQLHRIVGQPQLVTPENFGQTNFANGIFGVHQGIPSTSTGQYFTTSTQQISTPQASANNLNLFNAGVPDEATTKSSQLLTRNELENERVPIEIQFEIRLAGIELNAQLLSSLKAKYKLRRATGSGRSGNYSDFSAEVADHHLFFQVTSPASGKDENLSGNTSMPIDTFTLQLPRICANGAFKANSTSANSVTYADPSKSDGWNSTELVYRKEGYYDITILMGSMIHTFSTDLLNQILFAEQSFRSELSFLLERLSSERPKTASGTSFLNVNPILFNLEIKGEGIPWLQITATTPTSIAIRFTVDSPHAVFTNRLVRAQSKSSLGTPVNKMDADNLSKNTKISDKEFDHRLFGRAKIQLNMKLGQLYKSALYEETQEELEEYANFMTQISVQNEDSITTDTLHTFSILLNRPFLLIKSNAIDKAILLWLNYRNTYNYWRKEREKLLMSHRVYENKSPKNLSAIREGKSRKYTARKSSEKVRDRSPGGTTSANFAADMNINLSLSIQNGLYVCMPLYSPEPSDNLAALMLSLQKSDVTVCVKKELACNANFDAFKVSFIDNFDEQTLSEPWLYEAYAGDSTHSNYFFFPHGSYKFCTSAISPNAENRNAKWILSVKSHMQGMIIDFDYKIGKLTSLLVHTLSSSFTFDDEMVEDYAPSDSSFAFTATGDGGRRFEESGVDLGSEIVSSAMSTTGTNFGERCAGSEEASTSAQCFQLSEKMLSDPDGEELSQVVGHENRVRWLERKMHEQSVLVTDLMNLGASEFAIEKERRKLRILELSRFKHFRQSMWDKIRQKMDHKYAPTDNVSQSEQKLLGNFDGSATSAKLAAKKNFVKSHKRQSSRTILQPNVDHTMPDSSQNLSPDPNAFNRSQQPQTESVDMNIDVQINIECGQCILRANQPPPSAGHNQRFLLTKKPSARDLKAKNASNIGTTQAVTKLSIPSLNANMFYTSNDPIATPPTYISRLFPREKSQKFSPNKNKCFYMALELASMPLETLITPSLADFLEQVVEPLPEFLFEPSSKAPTAENASGVDSVPIVAIDASSLPLDVLFHMSVQSSTIRFEGQQQRSSAADCLLTLPGLTLMASTRKYDEQDRSLAGIYLSATLSSFSLNIYSPHQQSSAHDAFSLTLDRFSITASRSKNPFNNEDDRNRVELVILSNVGSANFNYDMRRLSELLTFPRPWYRKQLVRRLFFGEHSIPQHHNNSAYHSGAAAGGLSRGADSSNASSGSLHSTPKFGLKSKPNDQHAGGWEKTRSSLKSTSSAVQLKQREWAASVVFSMQWKELNVNAQMSNTMGNTVWLARKGIFRGHLQLDSKRHRDVAVSFKLHSSELNAQGGAISGEASISKLLISARHIKKNDKAPENQASLQFEKVESRIEWMSRPIFIGRFMSPKIFINDEWNSQHDNSSGEVSKAFCLINISASWDDLQMIITKNTVGDMIKIVQKLIAFFKDQLKSSRIVWDQEFLDGADTGDSSTSSDDGTGSRIYSRSFSNSRGRRIVFDKLGGPISAKSDHHRSSASSFGSFSDDGENLSTLFTTHWQKVLDILSDVQLHQKFLPLPTADDGATFVGGNIELRAERVSLACMNGEMNASSWALFHMKEVGTLFNCRSAYTFLDNEAHDIGIEVKHRFVFALGESREKLRLPLVEGDDTADKKQSVGSKSKASGNKSTDYNAIVCRVQHRGFLMRHNASVDLLLEAMIGDVLKQLEPQEQSKEKGAKAGGELAPRFTHNVLRLFLFPPLEAILKTHQNEELVDSARQRRKSLPGASSSMANVVESTFVCDFYDAVCVQTDFNAQVGFLPELLKSYMVSQPEIGADVTPRRNAAMPPSASALTLSTSGGYHHHHHHQPSSSAYLGQLNAAGPHSASATKDLRQYICSEWTVDPRIIFIDRFKWNPPVIDDILKKLQIFDHRQTIPKVLQRGLLDRCDFFIAAIEKLLVSQVKRE